MCNFSFWSSRRDISISIRVAPIHRLSQGQLKPRRKDLIFRSIWKPPRPSQNIKENSNACLTTRAHCATWLCDMDLTHVMSHVHYVHLTTSLFCTSSLGRWAICHLLECPIQPSSTEANPCARTRWYSRFHLGKKHRLDEISSKAVSDLGEMLSHFKPLQYSTVSCST